MSFLITFCATTKITQTINIQSHIIIIIKILRKFYYIFAVSRRTPLIFYYFVKFLKFLKKINFVII